MTRTISLLLATMLCLAACSSEEAKEKAAAMESKAQQAAAMVKDTAADLAEDAAEMADGARQRAGDAMSSMKDAAESVGETAGEATQALADSAGEAMDKSAEMAADVQKAAGDAKQAMAEKADQAVAKAADTAATVQNAVATRVAQAGDAVDAAGRSAEQTAQSLVAAGEGKFTEGKDYLRLTPTQPTSSAGDKVEIAEVFMYSCPHCFSFEPFVADLERSKPANVNVVRIPASFNATARLHTKAYYAFEAMGLLDQIHTAFFQEVHGNRNMMPNEDAIADFVASQGVNRDEFMRTFNSFAIDTKVRQADTLARRYQIRSVPTVVINGKYVTQGSMVGSTSRLKDVISYLVAKETAGVD